MLASHRSGSSQHGRKSPEPDSPLAADSDEPSSGVHTPLEQTNERQRSRSLSRASPPMYPDVSAFDDNVEESSCDGSLSDTLPEGQLVEQLRAATQEMTISTAG